MFRSSIAGPVGRYFDPTQAYATGRLNKGLRRQYSYTGQAIETSSTPEPASLFLLATKLVGPWKMCPRGRPDALGDWRKAAS